MSKLVKRIEKEFFLKVLYDEQLPVTYYKDRVEYTLFLKGTPKDTMTFKTSRAIDGLTVSSKISLMFSYHGDSMLFDVDVMDMRDGEVVCRVPESIRKNLDRSHMRVNLPPEVNISVSFQGDRFNLPFPKLRQYYPVKGTLSTLASLREQVEKLVKDNDYGYKLVVFNKQEEISSPEERLIAHMGKTLFLPEVKSGFPKEDPYNQSRIVTEDVFNRYLLENMGIEGRTADAVSARFFQEKTARGVVSDVWVPILFQEYTVGYIRVWIREAGKLPLDFMVIDTLHKYAEVMAQVLKQKGYFDQMKSVPPPFRANVKDISVSGLLFTCPIPELSMKLMVGCDLQITVATLRRSLDINATITRNYREKASTYIGCQFKDMNADDIRYLFECIYAKPFTDTKLPH
ncbi:MAG: PilZ domain-containing protein [Treponema sp.]|nr:PilZ domain-containing protein [Treponema sp.]